MAQVKVTTKEQLKTALKAKEKDILIQGDALKLYKTVSKLKTMGKFGAAVAIGGIAAIPFTGGASSILTAGAVTTTLGLTATGAGVGTMVTSAAATTFIAFMGVSLLVSMFKNYKEIEVSGMGINLKFKK